MAAFNQLMYIELLAVVQVLARLQLTIQFNTFI